MGKKGIYIMYIPIYRREVGSCVKVAVDVLGSPSQIILMTSVDVKQLLKKKSGVQSSGTV